MATVVSSMDPCLKVGISTTAVLDFNSEWCRAYLKLSGDTNFDLHLPEPKGKGIVQGMAVMTRVGATISVHMPNFMVVKISEIRFKKPVLIGNQLYMKMERLDNNRRLTQVNVSLEKPNGECVSSFQVTLVPSS